LKKGGKKNWAWKKKLLGKSSEAFAQNRGKRYYVVEKNREKVTVKVVNVTLRGGGGVGELLLKRVCTKAQP